MTKGNRGGKRPGAGAPKGNRNALQHGRRSADPVLAKIIGSLPAALRPEAIKYLRSTNRTIKRRLDLLDAIRGPAKPITLLPFKQKGAPTTHTTQQDVQSNTILAGLSARLQAHGFFGAHAFAFRHSPAAPALAAILDYLDELTPNQYKAIRSPAGLIRTLFHEEIADVGPFLTCPYCGWTSTSQRKEQLL